MRVAGLNSHGATVPTIGLVGARAVACGQVDGTASGGTLGGLAGDENDASPVGAGAAGPACADRYGTADAIEQRLGSR